MTTPVFEVVKPGPSTTIRGGPTYGRAHLGFSVGGAFDPRSHAIANALVGNANSARALEIVLGGVELRALVDIDVGVAGAIELGLVHVRTDDVLSIAMPRAGLRTYVALPGGIDDDEERTMRKGDVIRAHATHAASRSRSDDGFTARFGADVIELRVVDSVQSSMFARDALDRVFTVAPTSDRRGVRLAGARIEGAREILTEGANVGAVQVPPSGEPIILGVDRSATGGYAKIANVIAEDRWMLGQLRPGARVRLVRVERGGDG